MRRATAALLALWAAGCGGEGAAVGPVDVDLGGGFAGTVDGADRLVVRAADGRVLLDGLAPKAVADGSPPLTGFAVRDVTTTYEMQFGAFKPTDVPAGAWRVAERLAGAQEAAGLRIDVADAKGARLASLRFTAPDAGHLAVEVTPGDGPERRFSWGFACDEADHFAGFGAQTADADHRGQTVTTFVQEQGVGKAKTDEYDASWFLVGRRHSSHAPIPEYLARRGYVLVADTDVSSTFAMCSERSDAARVEVTMPAVIHLFDGPSPKEAITRASATFGRPRMPPKVAFAPWNDAVFGSVNVRRVAQKLRDEGIPVSVIWTEDWRGGDWNKDNYALKEEWETDTSLYPDLPALASDLHALGFDFHVYFNPFVYEGTKAWSETQPKGLLVKREDGTDYVFPGAKFTQTGLLDLDNPEGRAWAVSKMRAVMAQGADGWMNDFAEWLPTDAVTAAGPAYERHNLYPVRWQETAREAIDGAPDASSTDRLFFGRSGWLGTPQLTDVFWAGDQRTSMAADDGLPTVLPLGIGLGVTGMSTFGSDIGGYQSATNAGATREVYFRWTSLGAWSPVMRTHHGAQPLLNWTWETDDETIAHFRRYAKLHIALVPYWEGLAKVASETGVPIWRGMALEFPEDAALWAITDEVLVGPRVLVAPVMVEGAVTRDVVLPAGRWYPWEGGAAIEGGASAPGGGVVSAAAAASEIPVYAAAGAVVPMYPDGVMTLVRGSAAVPGPESVGDDRVVRVFLGASGAFAEASGMTYAVEQVGEDIAGTATLTWEGAALAACASPAVAPCAEGGADGATAHVTGNGTLEVASGGAVSARTVIAGGKGDRAVTLVLRW